MKIKIESRMSLMKMRKLLVEFLEICNGVNEQDFKTIVLASQKDKKNIKGILDNALRGNLFMLVFFLRELLESLLNSSD